MAGVAARHGSMGRRLSGLLLLALICCWVLCATMRHQGTLLLAWVLLGVPRLAPPGARGSAASARLLLRASLAENEVREQVEEVDPEKWEEMLDRLGESEEVYDDAGEAEAHAQMLEAKMAELSLEAEMRDRFSVELLRIELTEAIFRKLDERVTGRVDSNTAWKFAAMTGFDGNEVDWKEEFRCICEDFDCSEAEGLNMTVFKHLVDDAGGDSPCTNEELGEIYARLKDEKINSKKTRAEDKLRFMKNAAKKINFVKRKRFQETQDALMEERLADSDMNTVALSHGYAYDEPDVEGIQSSRKIAKTNKNRDLRRWQ